MDEATIERLTEATRAALLRHPSVQSVELVGSRRSGQATALSDVDLLVVTDDFESVRSSLPDLLAPLHPLAAQWDRLSEEASYYMVILPGALKVDLVFDRPPVLPGPWVLDLESLRPVDAHFWDWVLWLAAKEHAGQHQLVEMQLREPLFHHILRPLGVATAPASVRAAVEAYVAARASWERHFGKSVDRALQRAVLARLQEISPLEWRVGDFD